MLLTRSPLTHPSKNQDRPVRLACVKHAASVRPEPGSNSPKKTKNKTNQPQATTTHTPTSKPGHAHQQPTTRKTKTNQKTRTAHPQRHKTPHNHHHKQRSSNHTRPHNATDRPWHKKQAHYRDLKQHTHKTRPAGTFTDHSRSRHRIRLSRSASAGQAPGPATLVTRPRKDFAADRSAVPVSLLR